MKTYSLNSNLFLAILVCLSIFIFFTQCEPTKPTNQKAIVTLYGEVTKSTAQIEDSITYKIYYFNPTNKKTSIAITDTLDKGLQFVQASDGGSYDASNQVISWVFPTVSAKSHGFVTIKAVIKGTGTLSNKATIYFVKTGLRKIGEIRDVRPSPSGSESVKFRKIITNIVTTQVCKQPKLGWLPFYSDSKENEIVTGTLKDETTTDIMIHFDIPGMLVNQVRREGIAFHKITVPGNAWMTEIGKPELPILGRMIEIPKGVSITAKIVKADTLSFPCYNIYPAQFPEPDNNAVVDTFIQDTLYGQDILYPGVPSVVRDEDIAVMRGHRLLFLKVSPFQYNPATKRLKVYRQIEVKLEYDKPAQVESIDKRLFSTEYEKVLKTMLLNYKDQNRFLDQTALRTYNNDNDDKPNRGCDYLIISANNYYNANDNNNPIVRLAKWKEQKGLVTWVRTISDITGGNTANSIETFIQNAYDTWSPPPTYVLLVGDADEIVTNYQTQHSAHNNTLNGTDLYYSTTDGTDYFPDLFIGRLSVENANQLQDVVDKIIDYEQSPPNNAAFYTDVQLTALFEDDNDLPPDPEPEDGTEDRPWIENVEEIFEYLDNNGYNPERVYASSSGWPGDPASSQPTNYENGNTLPVDLRVASGFGWNGDGNDITNGINNGRFLVTYRDHGSRTGWSGFIGFTNNDVDNLANGALTPVVLSFACENGWFDNETDAAGLNTGLNAESFCEHFLRNANGGAVAIFGATRDSWTGPNDFLMFGFHKAIWSDFEPNPPITGYPAVPDRESTTLFEMGQIHSFAKCYMANAYTHSNSREMTFEMYHLFGDPEMSIWTESPARLKVDHPDGIGSTGVQDFMVNVTNNTNGDPVGMATVTLTRGDNILKVLQTNPNGDARFTLSSLGNGDIDLTVVKDNYVPYMETITVVNNGAQINRLDPDNNISGSDIKIGGKDFSGNEQVEIFFDGSLLKTVTASGGEFGQSGGTDVKITIPVSQDIGYYTVVAKGKTSGRYAVDVLIVRKANPIDLFTYSQWDNSTWSLHPGANPTWDNPEIQLYDASNNPVSSNNLIAGQTYTIKLKVHNTTSFNANNAVVTFKYANFGVGQPDRVWQLIGDATINVPSSTTKEAEIKWTTPGTGHLCVKGDIYHIEDINTENNGGQENCHVGPTSSPAVIPFTVWNPTKKPAMVYFELRQIGECDKEEDEWKYWASWIIHPEPQLIQPGDSATVKVTIDPDLVGNKIRPGECVEFALTGYIDKKVLGGVNFDITKK